MIEYTDEQHDSLIRGHRKQLADAQATVEALQRERDAWKGRYEAAQALVNGAYEENGELRTALDAEREKLVAVAKERDVQCTLKQNCISMLEQEREKVAFLEKKNANLVEASNLVLKVKADQDKRISAMQTDLTQLQALVRAISETMEPFRKSLAKLDEVDTLATRRIAEADAYYCAQRALATLDATIPADTGGTK